MNKQQAKTAWPKMPKLLVEPDDKIRFSRLMLQESARRGRQLTQPEMISILLDTYVETMNNV